MKWGEGRSRIKFKGRGRVDVRFRLEIWENKGKWAMADRHGSGSSFGFVRSSPSIIPRPKSPRSVQVHIQSPGPA